MGFFIVMSNFRFGISICFISCIFSATEHGISGYVLMDLEFWQEDLGNVET